MTDRARSQTQRPRTSAPARAPGAQTSAATPLPSYPGKSGTRFSTANRAGPAPVGVGAKPLGGGFWGGLRNVEGRFSERATLRRSARPPFACSRILLVGVLSGLRLGVPRVPAVGSCRVGERCVGSGFFRFVPVFSGGGVPRSQAGTCWGGPSGASGGWSCESGRGRRRVAGWGGPFPRAGVSCQEFQELGIASAKGSSLGPSLIRLLAGATRGSWSTLTWCGATAMRGSSS